MSNRAKYLTAAILLTVSTSSLAGEGAAAFQVDFLAGKLSWDAVMHEAQKEGEVQFYYWGGSDELNIWIDSVATPAMAD
ncbi:MAG: ABC transporter substrate-binding protein, partial [Devosia sp.]|nr:ABC transporter substrate-binding protein [Devosia sp.]